MSVLVRRSFPLGIAAIVGILMILELFQVGKEITSSAAMVRDWVVIISGFALCLGAVHVTGFHVNQIRKRTAGRWPFSIVLLAVMFSYIAVGVSLTTMSGTYRWLYDAINFPLAQVMFSLLAFYIFSAAVRAFQARNFEAVAFLLCAILVVIGNIPSMPLISSALAQIGPWILDVPTKGAFRGLLITAALGIIVLGIRTLLGRETAYLGRA